MHENNTFEWYFIYEFKELSIHSNLNFGFPEMET